MIKLRLVIVLAFTLLVGSASAAADPVNAQREQWVPPEEGAHAMFRTGDRAFSVGADAGGAGSGRVTAQLQPAPGCDPISNSRCAQNTETCSGSCVAYMSYYCKSCDCQGFRFC